MNKIWFGKIPNDWKTIKAKFLFSERCEKGNSINLEILTPSQKFGVLPQKKYQEVTGTKPVQVNENTDLSNFKTVHKNDYCISLSAYMGGFEYSEYEGVISPAYHSFYQIDDIYDNNYLKKLFKSSCFIDEINCITPNSVRVGRNTSFEKFGNILMPIPTKEEQNKIANFLDNKILVIDNVIEKTRETIEDYKKYKQSIITEVVTKGLDKSTKVKNSGIEWIKKIPESWDINKIKNICRFNPNYADEFKVIDECGYIPMDLLKFGYAVPSKIKMSDASTGLTKFIDKDIIMAKVTPCFENGEIAIVDKLFNGVGLGSSELFVFNCSDNKVKKEFLFYLLQNILLKDRFTSTMIGVGGLKRVSPYYLKNSYIPIPSVEEQKKIVKYLDDKCNKIEELINNKKDMIEELEKYKKSLIYEYVTGKKEVSVGKNTEIAELSLRIIEQLPNNYSMCKIKLNKIQSVILKMIRYKKEPDYEKYAAGPYSKEMMNNVYNVFKTEKWVKITKNGMRDVYTLDKNFKDGIKRYKEHFKENDDEIIRIIKLFENKDTQESEIIATLFYCWNDFLIDGIQPTDEQIIEKFYNWSKRKKNIEIAKVKKNLVYMKKNNLIPNGYGKKTIQRSNNYGRK